MEDYNKWKLANAIARPTLWKDIEDYIDSLNQEGLERWTNYVRTDVTSFVSKYYPDAFEKHDKSVFAMMTRVFTFLKEITIQEVNADEFIPYSPDKYSGVSNEGEEKDIKDIWDSGDLLSDVEYYFSLQEEEIEEESNPLYEGEDEYVTEQGNVKERINPKQSLKKHIVISDESKTGKASLRFLRNDFYYKTDIVKKALKGDDEEYNEKILKEFYELCKTIMNNKYIWDDEEREFEEIIKEYLPKDYIEVFYENQAKLEEKRLKQAVWSHDAAFLIFNYYRKNKDEEVYNFFLKVLVMAVFQSQTEDCREKWDVLEVLNNEELEDLFSNEFLKFYQKVKTENDQVINEIFDRIAGKEDLIFNKKITKEDTIEFEPIFIEEFISFPVLDLEFHTGDPFGIILPDADVFNIKSDNAYKEWLLSFIQNLGKKADEFYKNNSSYKKLIINRTEVKDDSEIEYSCPDMDFSIFEKELKEYYLDDFVKTGYWKIIDNKKRIDDFNLFYKIIKPEDTQVDEYIREKGYVINKGLDSLIYADLVIILNSLLDDVKTPEDFKNYIEKQRLVLNSITILKNAYEKWLNEQMEKVQKIASEWDTSVDVEEILDTFFKEIKDKVVNLYSNNLSDDQYNHIVTETKNMITTGETLYHTFISREQQLKDYGIVAMNYYKALEYLLNQILYRPYKIFLDKKIKEITEEKRKTNPNFKNITEKHTIGYYGESFGFICKKNINEERLMLGTLYKLFNLKEDENDVHLISFLKKKNINIERLKKYDEQLEIIKELRNECAHPNVVPEAFAVRGRIAIYKNEDEEKAKNEKRASQIFEMILRIKDLFN